MTIATYTSAPNSPAERGYQFGARFADEISHNVAFYRRLFAATGNLNAAEIADLGTTTLSSIAAWAPTLAEEIEGIAAGAYLEPSIVAALNARTEILGVCRAVRHECTVAVALRTDGAAPTAVQTWDWHDEVAGSWLIWTIQDSSGRLVRTLTEYGIVGKLGVNSSRLALLLNILRHSADGERIGVPIHAIARRVLDEAEDMNQALTIIATAAPSASSAMTLVAVEGQEQTALTVEVSPLGPVYVYPDPDGTLIHTNHFLDRRRADGDEEPVLGPDSFLRYDLTRRRMHNGDRSADAVIAAMNSHLGGAGAICCHPDEQAQLGDRYATLATVVIDFDAVRLDVHPGGPCSHPRIASAPARVIS